MCVGIRVSSNAKSKLSALLVNRSHKLLIYLCTLWTKQLVLTNPQISSIERDMFCSGNTEHELN